MAAPSNTPTPAQALGEVLKLSEKATPGPWEWDEDGHRLGNNAAVIDFSNTCQGADARIDGWGAATGCNTSDEQAFANASLIAAAVNFIREHGQHFAGLEARVSGLERMLVISNADREAAEARCSELEGGCQMLREEVEGLRAAFLAAKGERHE